MSHDNLHEYIAVQKNPYLQDVGIIFFAIQLLLHTCIASVLSSQLRDVPASFLSQAAALPWPSVPRALACGTLAGRPLRARRSRDRPDGRLAATRLPPAAEFTRSSLPWLAGSWQPSAPPDFRPATVGFHLARANWGSEAEERRGS